MYQDFSYRIENSRLSNLIRENFYKYSYSSTEDKKTENSPQKKASQNFNKTNQSISENELSKESIRISLKSGNIEKFFDLFKLPVRNKEIIKFSTKGPQPFDIHLSYNSLNNELTLNLIINFESMKSVADLIDYSELYNRLFTQESYLNGEPLDLKKNENAILIKKETLNYFKKIREIEEWLDLYFTNFQDLFNSTSIDGVEDLINSKNTKPSVYPYEVKKLKTEIESNSNNLDELSEKITGNQSMKLQLYFKTAIDFSLFDCDFTLPSVVYIDNYEVDTFDKIDSKKSFIALKKPNDKESLIQYISFKDNSDLDLFYKKHATGESIVDYFISNKVVS